MADKISALSDREMLAELRVYNNAASAAPENYNLTAHEAENLKTRLDEFEAELDAWDQIRTQYDAQLEAKNAIRETVLGLGRAQRRQTRSKADISNETLATVGLAPRKGSRSPSPDPTSVPFALIEYGKLRHTLNFRDKETPGRSRKPAGMLGAEIWLKLGGEPPVDNRECRFVTVSTATPAIVIHDGADAGKTVWYLLRWVSRNGRKGDWSDPVGATVNG